MGNRKRLIAEIPLKHRKDGISWLILEEDTDGTKGWFLFMHESLNEPCKFDSWHETKDKAVEQAKFQWTVGEKDWKSS